jgi:hypothetical protein
MEVFDLLEIVLNVHEVTAFHAVQDDGLPSWCWIVIRAHAAPFEGVPAGCGGWEPAGFVIAGGVDEFNE